MTSSERPHADGCVIDAAAVHPSAAPPLIALQSTARPSTSFFPSRVQRFEIVIVGITYYELTSTRFFENQLFGDFRNTLTSEPYCLPSRGGLAKRAKFKCKFSPEAGNHGNTNTTRPEIRP